MSNEIIRNELLSILPNLDNAINPLVEVSEKLKLLKIDNKQIFEKTINEINKVIVDLLATKQTITTYNPDC